MQHRLLAGILGPKDQENQDNARVKNKNKFLKIQCSGISAGWHSLLSINFPSTIFRAPALCHTPLCVAHHTLSVSAGSRCILSLKTERGPQVLWELLCPQALFVDSWVPSVWYLFRVLVRLVAIHSWEDLCSFSGLQSLLKSPQVSPSHTNRFPPFSSPFVSVCMESGCLQR